MNRAEASELLAAELTHIPRWPGEHQGVLRAVSHRFRAIGLGRKAAGAAGDTLRRCLATIRRDFPDARLDYDGTFFDV